MKSTIKSIITLQAALVLVAGVAFLLMLYIAYQLGHFAGYLDTLKIMSGQMPR